MSRKQESTSGDLGVMKSLAMAASVSAGAAGLVAVSAIVGRMISRARARADAEQDSRREVEALYALSVEVLRAASGTAAVGGAAARALEMVGAASGGVILFGVSAQQQQVVAWTGPSITEEVEDVAAGVGRHRRVTEIPSRFGRDVYLPLTSGGRVGGCLVARGTLATLDALESVGTLVALALERERFITERAHVEALRESNDLKTSLLQAVAHDLNSPLTVLSVETEALERKGPQHESAAAHVRTIREQLAQLKRRIENLLSLARFEAGMIHPRVEPTSPADLFRAARESLASIAQTRTLRASVTPEAPDLLADPSLALEIVINLIENAHHASPPDGDIELVASRSLDDPRRGWVEVLDRGLGLSASQQRALKVIELSDTGHGLGIGIARRLATLSGGSVEWFPREGGGTIARLDLPAAPVAPEEPQ